MKNVLFIVTYTTVLLEFSLCYEGQTGVNYPTSCALTDLHCPPAVNAPSSSSAWNWLPYDGGSSYSNVTDFESSNLSDSYGYHQDYGNDTQIDKSDDFVNEGVNELEQFQHLNHELLTRLGAVSRIYLVRNIFLLAFSKDKKERVLAGTLAAAGLKALVFEKLGDSNVTETGETSAIFYGLAGLLEFGIIVKEVYIDLPQFHHGKKCLLKLGKGEGCEEGHFEIIATTLSAGVGLLLPFLGFLVPELLPLWLILQGLWIPLLTHSRHLHDVTSKIDESTGHGGPTSHHSCYRPCSTDPSTEMTCWFNFTVANYYTLSPHCLTCPNKTLDCAMHGCVPADGRQRPIAVVNKEMPGPAIRVCQGDTVVVNVENKLVGQETSIHWHGIHQKETPWMDGVPHLTQCPIPEGSTFRYQFHVPEGGTYYWHSHAGVQRADGVAGNLIVRKAPEVELHGALYDYDLAEHEIILWDWLSGLALAGHLMGHVTDERELVRSILVQGKGFPPGFFDDFEHHDALAKAKRLLGFGKKHKPFVPIHEVRIEHGWSYRFRLISNGVTLCPVELSIEHHNMLVIASDGFDVEPVLVESLVIHAGERFDFVVRGDQPVGSYWMKFRGLIDCNTTKTFQLATLNYEGTPLGAMPNHAISTWEEAGPTYMGLQLNPVNVAPGIPGESITIAEMSSIVDNDPEITEREFADHQFYLNYDFNPVSNVNFGIGSKEHTLKVSRQKASRGGSKSERIVHFLPQLNFISHTMPVAPPLIQPEMIDSIDRCNAASKWAEGIDCMETHCKCTHWLNVKLNSIVEIVLVDMGVRFDAAHPFHLHGHSFRVVSLVKLGNTTSPEIIQEMDAHGLVPRRRTNAPIKDAVYVPDGGYTIVRFRANNPGYWFFHCHIEFHQERGMALIFQVGNSHEIPRAPAHFPTCGNYMPPVAD